MNAADLKNIQAPLKEKYREDATAALITLNATGKIGENISCRIDTSHAMIEAGLHPATGGSGLQACSGDLLLQALVACAGVTMSAVATAIGIEIIDGSVKAEGDLDFRGTLGVSKEVAVGIQSIRLIFNLQTAASDEQVKTLLNLTERYCVVYQTLAKGVAVNVLCENDPVQD
ncbi:MAG TPA: OsmC family protein [Flavisolibacter sp.]|nr:OsmC family protein [Flavisolibacter sp.]